MTDPPNDIDQEEELAEPGRIMLALCETFRDVPASFIAPEIPGNVLASAFLGYLQLQADEVLLAIIDESKQAPTGVGCALTTRRIYWSDSPGHGQSVAYEELPETMISASSGPVMALDLGEGRRITLGGHREAVDVLRDFLTAMRALTGAHEGDWALPDVQQGWLRQDWPEVVAWSDRMREANHSLRSYDKRLYRARRPVVVPAIVVACVTIYGLMVASGVLPTEPTVQNLFEWGGSFAPAIAVDGQYWRLLTPMFVHGGMVHLIMNMWCLIAGRVIERFYGHLGFAALYVLSGFGAELVSLGMHSKDVVAVGASGAIFGIYGGLLAFLLVQRNVPKETLKPMRASVVGFLGYNLIFNLFAGVAASVIDVAAHAGGLATGFVVGLLLTLASGSKRNSIANVRRSITVAVLAVILGLAGWFEVALIRTPLIAAIEARVRAVEAVGNEIDAVADQMVELANQLGEGDPLLFPILRVNALAARVEALEPRIKALPADNEAMLAFRDRVASCRGQLVRAIDVLRRCVTTGDKSLLDAPNGFTDAIKAYVKEIGELEKIMKK